MKKILFLTFFILIIFFNAYPQEKEPVLYLEFTDLSKLLSELKRDKHYRDFIASSVLKWYKNTRLGLKFPKRIKRFEDILGFSLSLKNIETISGKETSIWLFDVGELKLLFITRLSKSDYLKSQLSRVRESFGEARIDTVAYYFKKDTSGDKEIDFVFFDGYLILSNEPGAFEFYLKRLIKDRNFKKWKENDFLTWFDKPVNKDYDLFIYLSPLSIRNTYFASYWFYDNQSEIKDWFDRGMITVEKGKDKIEEIRIFNLTDSFTFDSSTLAKTDELFSTVPQNADLIKILPVSGKELGVEMKQLLGDGKIADSIFVNVKAMRPLCFGQFAKIRKGEILPELDEGIAIVVEKPDKEFSKIFDKFFPVNLRTNELFSKNMPDYFIDGNILFFSNKKDFFKRRETIKQDGTTSYSWLNLEGFEEGYKKEIELLKKQDNWHSYEDRDFFVQNINDLVGILSRYIKTVEKREKYINGKMFEKIIYTTK